MKLYQFMAGMMIEIYGLGTLTDNPFTYLLMMAGVFLIIGSFADKSST